LNFLVTFTFGILAIPSPIENIALIILAKALSALLTEMTYQYGAVNRPQMFVGSQTYSRVKL